MVLDGQRTSRQSLSSSLAIRLPSRKRDRIARPADTSSFCEEIAHYPVFNPRDPRHNPAASSSWLQSDYYQSEASKSQSSIRWMQELPRRSLRKAKSGLLALRSGIQRRPLPDSMQHIGDIPNIWSSTDSTGDSSDQFPSSVSDASTEDDGEFGTGLYRAVRNHSSPLYANMESDGLNVPSATGLLCGSLSESVSQGSSPTLRQEPAISDSIGIKANEIALDPGMRGLLRQGPRLDNRKTNELLAQVQQSSHFPSTSLPSSIVGLSVTQAIEKASSQSSPNLQLTASHVEKTCAQFQTQSSGLSSLETSKPNAAKEAAELLDSSRGAPDELSRGHEIDSLDENTRLSDTSPQIEESSCSLRKSPIVSPRQSSVPQITGIQLVMEPLQLFPRRDSSSGGQTLCCSEITNNHPHQETSIGDFIGCVASEDMGESAHMENSPLDADEGQVSQMDARAIVSVASRLARSLLTDP
ncbi:uncharacterized protein ACLA_068790 [Aspergillus clavatus NRRL 1]|uniref:Uncharacterized protein n=1 Tax=Aspergillus clavatus (strain ATCC 1007 / CBS 513.65 / DSM 816 / NCTC 3887 / NRRL 1 / QM 1276 / 107) TaxID=344612 RepID=A1C630_ASPCL|nr:uncharacterized protein ACLA_068790 [Aspergillus clavatus NRRL 1]EAW13851.1 conserved hypothetical protein [Aspergillus clavatus NRRL 1]